jgi:hypothetical protein
MAHAALMTVGHAVRDNPWLVFLLGFLAPLTGAYWFFAVLPYRNGRPEDALAPRDLGRPAVPGVLEQFATWEWASRDPLAPFGVWLSAELGRQNRSLVELAQEAGLGVEDLRPLLHGRALKAGDLARMRRLAVLLGASESQVDRLFQGVRQSEVEAHRHQ